jgi:hypothetical protein
MTTEQSTLSVKELWEQTKKTVDELEKDVSKTSEKHNCSAGVRVRHGARDVVKLCKLLVAASKAADKATKVTRAASRPAKAATTPAPTV